MKKIVALMLVLMIALLTGCGGNEDTEKPRKEREEKKTTAVKDTKGKDIFDKLMKKVKKDEPDEDEPDEDEPENEENAEINELWLDLMGKDSEEIAGIKGGMSDNIWADGPLYRCGSETVGYGVDAYDFAESSGSIPLGGCNYMCVPLNMLLKTEGNCNAQALEKAVGKVLTEGFDAMYECNTYSVTYKGYRFIVYEDSASAISGLSNVDIRKE